VYQLTQYGSRYMGVAVNMYTKAVLKHVVIMSNIFGHVSIQLALPWQAVCTQIIVGWLNVTTQV